MNTTAEFEAEILRLEECVDRYDAIIATRGDNTGILALARESVLDSIKAVKVLRAEKVVDLRMRVYVQEKHILDIMSRDGEDNQNAEWRAQCRRVNEAQDAMEWAQTSLRRIKNGLPS